MKKLLTAKLKLSFICLNFSTVVFLLSFNTANAQDTVLNKYGLWVIDDIHQLSKTVKLNPAKAMVDLKIKIPTILFDLRYAGLDNFMQEKLYPSITTSYLRSSAADSLSLVQNKLNDMGLGLKIFDAYRPYSITEKMWEPVKDDRYAADPKKGSGHNRGIAIDLTIINLTTLKEFDMGTEFDNFSDTAHHTFTALKEEVLQNRKLLKSLMEKFGFKALDTEWWHYYLPNTQKYELLDLEFKQLETLNKKRHGKRFAN